MRIEAICDLIHVHMRTSSLVDKVLDRSIVLSFDRHGFERHSLRFDPADTRVDLHGHICLVTGSNSGIGRATALELARRGGEVWLLCRDEARGNAAARAIVDASGNAAVRVARIDLADIESIRAFAHAFTPTRVHVLVHNAGTLATLRSESPDGNEVTFATHVLGPFLLTHLLLPKLRAAAPSRVITVSSGGMFARKLTADDLQSREGEFDGVVAYARAKRAQVVLNEMWAERTTGSGIAFHCMHPGWVETDGVRESLPRFYRVMRKALRTPEQGADTVVFLAATRTLGTANGRFWFDRAPQSTHLVPWTRESESDRQRLWDVCTELTR